MFFLAEHDNICFCLPIKQVESKILVPPEVSDDCPYHISRNVTKEVVVHTGIKTVFSGFGLPISYRNLLAIP
jgi:hypothetical protein